MNEKTKNWIIVILVLIVVAGASYGVYSHIYGIRDTNAEYGRIDERLRQIDNNLKSEFRNLNQTITRGREETQGTRIIVETVRGSLEKDRETRGQLQDTSRKLKDALREIRGQKQEPEKGK